MTEPAFGVPLQISLDYQHALGQLSPYFAGLRRGELWATRCVRCNATWVAPRLVCTCGCPDVSWVTLDGRGTVQWVTRTSSALPATGIQSEMTFVLVRFDGATKLALARFIGPAEPGQGAQVRLRRPVAAGPIHPVQALEVEIAP